MKKNKSNKKKLLIIFLTIILIIVILSFNNRKTYVNIILKNEIISKKKNKNNSIKKRKIFLKTENEGTKEEYADSILFISFNKNILIDKVEEISDYLNKNQYTTINFEEFENWKTNVIQLPQKTVLIFYEGDNEAIIEVLKQRKIVVNDLSIINNYNITNDTYKMKKEDKNLYKYLIENDTSLENLQTIFNDQIRKSNQKIAVLNYHFFYDKETNCNEIICLNIKKLEEHLKYLNDNNIKAVTMKEFVNWYEGKLNLPDSSVLITIDDGAMGTSLTNENYLIPLLEKYKIKATLFLITSWFNIDDYKSDYLEVESHGNNIHIMEKECGYKINCISREELKEDIKKSLEITNSTLSFCYPFYMYNDNAFNVLEELNVHIAFESGKRKASKEDYKYKIPRYPIYKDISMKEFVEMVQ